MQLYEDSSIESQGRWAKWYINMYKCLCITCLQHFSSHRSGANVCSDKCRIIKKRLRAKEQQRIKRQDPAFREKQILYLRQYQENNRDDLNRNRREQYATDPDFRESRKQLAQRWARQNPERRKESCRRWNELNFDKVISRNHRNRTSWDLDPVLVKLVYEYYDYICVYCGKRGGKLSLEHILPVSRGGTDDFNNLAVACRRCNPKKGKKTLLEFLIYLGEL